MAQDSQAETGILQTFLILAQDDFSSVWMFRPLVLGGLGPPPPIYFHFFHKFPSPTSIQYTTTTIQRTPSNTTKNMLNRSSRPTYTPAHHTMNTCYFPERVS